MARQRQGDTAGEHERQRLLGVARTLEARVAELMADIDTLEAAITAMRRRYPGIEADWAHWACLEALRQRSSGVDEGRAREGEL